MGVAHDAASESHTGTTGSASEASFSWTHTPVGTPAGVVVFTYVRANADDALSVTYGGVSMTAVPNARAVDTVGEPRDCKAWFLGSNVPAGAQTVEVTRTNNANIMWAACATVTAAGETEVAQGSISTAAVDFPGQTRGIPTGPGVNSEANCMGYFGLHSALAAVPAMAANTTLLNSIDFGSDIALMGRLTTAATPSTVAFGWSSGTSDDTAAVWLAVQETQVPRIHQAQDHFRRAI